jgi:hypothetical protein
MPQPHPTATTTVDLEGSSQEGGSQTTEYALIMVVAATVSSGTP